MRTFLLIPALMIAGVAVAAEPTARDLSRQLDTLLNPSERETLLSLLSAVDPPESVHQLAGYDVWQHEMGGGLHGLMADQSAELAGLPIPVDETFAFTVGCLIRGWATFKMSGINIEQVKDRWPRLQRTMTEEVYHRVQLKLTPKASGKPARNFEDLVVHVDDAGLSKLYEALMYTVLEGSANLVAGPSQGVANEQRARDGSELLERFVHEVVLQDQIDNADALINQGLRNNGPMYALGYQMAAIVERHDGAKAVGTLLQYGPVAFAQRAIELAAEDGVELVGPDTRASVAELADALAEPASDLS